MKVVAVGDSITFGQHLAAGVSAWPDLVGAEGRGVCGETTRQALERWPRDVQADPADVTIIQYAHNDCNRWATDFGLPRVSLDAFKANLIEMIERCRACGTTPVLCTATPVLHDEVYVEDLLTYSCAVASVAVRWGVDLVDVRDAFYRHGNLPELLLDDGLHLSEAGHRLYAETVERTAVWPLVTA